MCFECVHCVSCVVCVLCAVVRVVSSTCAVCCVLVAAVRYTQAMIYEYPKSFRPLADMYYEGRATSKDLEMAKRLYKKAAKNGDELAQKKYLQLPASCVLRVCGGACAIRAS